MNNDYILEALIKDGTRPTDDELRRRWIWWKGWRLALQEYNLGWWQWQELLDGTIAAGDGSNYDQDH